MKKAVLTISLCVQMLLVGVLSVYVYSTREKPEIMEDIFCDSFASNQKPVDMAANSALETDGEVVPASGYLSISAPVEGVVEQAFVERGSEVEKGAPLFKIKDSNLYIEVKEKEEQLRELQAELAFKKMGPSPYAVLAKQKELEEASLKKDQGEKEATIFKGLLEEMAVSVVENEEKHLLAKLAQKEYEKTAAEMQALTSPMTKKEEAIYLHQIEEKKAALKQSTLKLKNATAYAPIAGKVVEVLTGPGDFLQGNHTYGVVMASNQLMVKVSIPEDHAYQVQRGKHVKAVATLPGKPSHSYQLAYHSYNPKLSIYEHGERKLELFFTFTEKQPELYLGQSLKVSLNGGGVLPSLSP
ncbi:biotin/lipoyl-binding protein [bacterium]|nr:biotin/lipoyl-binding protein [bacterium]